MSTIKLKPAELVLGDRVNLLPGEDYGWATVVNITADTVELVRPYVHIGDFTYTGGVLHYIGVETVRLWTGSDRDMVAHAHTHERMSQPGALK